MSTSSSKKAQFIQCSEVCVFIRGRPDNSLILKLTGKWSELKWSVSWVLQRNIHVLMRGSDDPLSFLPICYSWYFGTVVMAGSWPWKVLLTFAFVPKTYTLLWATLLFTHCSCMLMKERSIHIVILILQYFFTDSK